MEYIHDEIVPSTMPFDEPIDPGDRADVALLDSAVNRPFQTFDGRFLHPTIAQQSAALFHSLVCNHCFCNGNKRTAVLALDMFLAANGRALLLGNDDMYQLAKNTASANMNGSSCDDVLKQIAEEIEFFSVPFPDLLEEEPFKGMPHIQSFYRHCVEEQVAIRHNPKNQPQPNE